MSNCSSTAIDVFIPVFNDVTYLPHAIRSALAQTGVMQRIIVCDNASTDGTYEQAQSFAEQHSNVLVHRNSTNIGLVGNLNRFRDFVEAPYYMLLCSDDVLYRSDALASAASVVENNSDIVSVYCDLAYIDASGASLGKRRFKREGTFDAYRALRQSIVTSRNVFGIPLLNRTDTFKSLGYPEGMTYAGDVWMSAAAGAHGENYHIPDLLIGNRYTGENMTASVMTQSREQFARLAEKFAINLSFSERIQQKAMLPTTLIAKRAFLAYARRRKAAHGAGNKS